MAVNRCLKIGSAMAAAFSLSASVWAAPPVETNPPEIPQTLEEAHAQRERAKAMKQAAEERLAAEQAECYKKFLASSCLKDAKARYTQAVVEARNVDIPARAVERDFKRTEVEAKENRREVERPEREAEQKEQAAEFRDKEATRAAERERKIAEKTEQAAKYHAKATAEQAARRERQAERAKRDAERASQKARKTAEAASAAIAP